MLPVRVKQVDNDGILGVKYAAIGEKMSHSARIQWKTKRVCRPKFPVTFYHILLKSAFADDSRD
jgi:hypothetical protein